jgi:hypothetical protein
MYSLPKRSYVYQDHAIVTINFLQASDELRTFFGSLQKGAGRGKEREIERDERRGKERCTFTCTTILKYLSSQSAFTKNVLAAQ